MEAGARTWVELSGPYQERRVALRVGGDEDVEVYLHSSPARVTLEDVGLSEQDLADLDERQNPADNIEYDNTSWNYRLSREVRAWRDNQPQPLTYYYWEFLTPDGQRLLGHPQNRRRPIRRHGLREDHAGRRHGLSRRQNMRQLSWKNQD